MFREGGKRKFTTGKQQFRHSACYNPGRGAAASIQILACINHWHPSMRTHFSLCHHVYAHIWVRNKSIEFQFFVFAFLSKTFSKEKLDPVRAG